jgi:two-component system response regulator YesN
MSKIFKRLNINVRSVYFRILVSTLTITVIPILLIYIFVSAQTLKIVEQQSQVIDSQLLIKIQENTEQRLSLIQQDATTLADSRDILSFVFLPEYTDHTLIQRVGQDLSNIAASNTLISSAYVYSAYQGKLMSSDFRYHSIDGFHDKTWLSLYHQESAPVFWTEPRMITNEEGKRESHISLIVHVPSPSRKLSGAVVFNIKTSALDTEFLSGAQQSTGAYIDILDRDFQPLIRNQETARLLQELDTNWLTEQKSGSKSVRVGSERHLIAYTYSAKLGWYFIRTSPLKSIWNSTQQLWTTLGLFFVFLLLACFMAVRASNQLYRPVKQLVEDVTGQQVDKSALADEYGAIRAEYSHMQTKTTELESEITELQPLIKERFFLRLLRGQTDEAEQQLAQFGFTSHSFGVLMVRYLGTSQPADNSDMRYFQVRSRIEGILKNNALFNHACVETSGDTITALINFKESFSSADVRRTLLSLSKYIRETLSGELRIDTVTGFSPLCHSVSEIPSAYAAARKTIRFKLFQDSDDVVQENDELFAPYSTYLQDLLEQITAGNNNYVSAALEELFHAIRQNLETLSQFQIQQIATRILNSVIELLIQNKLKPEQVFGEKRSLFVELRQRDDLPSISQWMETVCLQASNELALIAAKKTNQKISRILEYIEQHISEDISLNDVADWVGLSPAYVSRTFKESIGQNFVEYLSICRVEQAKQLLKNTQMSIKEIGFNSGFNSMQTFIRTFKKLENCTPSQYRDKES